jgi:hypothetical protein
MTNRITTILFLALLLATVMIGASYTSLFAENASTQQSGQITSDSDLSNTNWDDDTEEKSTGKDSALSAVNWDEEGDMEEPSPDEKEKGDFSGESWEDEGDENESDAADGLQALNQSDIDKLDSEERQVHIYGFLLFIGYIFGGILTAFVTRNRKIAVSYPPELLILLHTFWPLELLLIPFGGKPVR